MAAALAPPEPLYVMDLCETAEGLGLVELNPFSGADLYACSPEAVVRAAQKVLEPEARAAQVELRPVAAADEDQLWAMLEPVIRAGETLALPRDMSRQAALEYWLAPGHEVLVASLSDRIVGTYYLHPNQQGGGAHVANCGYVTAPWSMGQGVARAMCWHSLQRARERGFRAMQFNIVVSTNERAVRCWRSCGFEVVGRLPGAFAHPTLGEVDALVMYRAL